MILGDKTNCTQDYQPQRSRQTLRERFHKYKSMIQSTQQQPVENRYEQIFSTLTYTSIVDKCALRGSTKSSRASITSIQQSLQLSESDLDGQHTYLLPSYFDHVSTENFTIMKPICEENMQKPIFIRQFNILNSNIPNYHHPKFNMKTQMKNLVTLIKSALAAINHVFGCALRMRNKNKQIKVFSLSNHCKFSLNFFMNSGWEKIKMDSNLLSLKPTENFTVNQPFEKILYELDLLLYKTARYQLAVSLTQTIGLDLYLNIRQNLIQIEEKLLECSHSIYVLGIKHQYPDFYYTYLQILRNTASFGPSQIEQVSNEFRRLWAIQEPITCSQIGRAVWNKLNTIHKL